MADEIDMAQQHEALLLAAQISCVSTDLEVEIPENHLCLNCDEPLSDPMMRWCDTDCQEDYMMRRGR